MQIGPPFFLSLLENVNPTRPHAEMDLGFPQKMMRERLLLTIPWFYLLSPNREVLYLESVPPP